MWPMTSIASNILFFFNDTATTEIYTLSLHDALPICLFRHRTRPPPVPSPGREGSMHTARIVALLAAFSCAASDRKSTRLNSSHSQISYAVFCLKKKRDRKSREL